MKGVRDEAARDRVVALLREGVPVQHAASRVGVSRPGVYLWAQTDPELAALLPGRGRRPGTIELHLGAPTPPPPAPAPSLDTPRAAAPQHVAAHGMAYEERAAQAGMAGLGALGEVIRALVPVVRGDQVVRVEGVEGDGPPEFRPATLPERVRAAGVLTSAARVMVELDLRVRASLAAALGPKAPPAARDAPASGFRVLDPRSDGADAARRLAL